MKLFTTMNRLYAVKQRNEKTLYGALSGLCRHTHFSGTVTSAVSG